MYTHNRRPQQQQQQQQTIRVSWFQGFFGFFFEWVVAMQPMDHHQQEIFWVRDSEFHCSSLMDKDPGDVCDCRLSFFW